MELAQFIADCRLDLADLLDESGRILYSSVDTLKPGDLYLLGLNPGSDPDGLDYASIGQSLDLLAEKNTNSYIDEEWDRGAGAGQDKLQRRVTWLLRSLGLNPRSVCASNLIFVRSQGEHDAGYPGHAHVCWPVHQRILRIVRPQAVLCFGNRPFRYLISKARSTAREVETLSSGHGDWLCRAVSGRIDGHQMNLVSIPHLSRYDVTTKPEVSEWIKRWISTPVYCGLDSAPESSMLDRRDSDGARPVVPTPPVRATEIGISRRDSSDIPFNSRMYRTGRPYLGRGKRETIWRCWPDGCTVGEFVKRAREVCGGGAEDVRIYWHAGVISLDPLPTTPIRRPR